MFKAFINKINNFLNAFKKLFKVFLNNLNNFLNALKKLFKAFLNKTNNFNLERLQKINKGVSK